MVRYVGWSICGAGPSGYCFSPVVCVAEGMVFFVVLLVGFVARFSMLAPGGVVAEAISVSIGLLATEGDFPVCPVAR